MSSRERTDVCERKAKRLARHFCGIIVLCSTVACERGVERVEVLFFPCDTPPARMRVGDTIHLLAGASSTQGIFGYRESYSSQESPRRFRWSKEPDSLAEITQDGLLTPTLPGHLRVAATMEGVTGYAEAVIEVPLTTVSVEAPTSVAVGDTIEVRFVARDVADSLVIGPFAPTIGSLDGAVLVDRLPRELGRVRLIAVGAGNGLVQWCYASRSGIVRVTVQ